jgi:hypothetical protein
MADLFKLIENNGLVLHGDIEHFAELVRQDEREQWDTTDMAHRSGGLTIEQAEKQEPVCDKDPHLCWSVRCQLGKVCKNTAPPKRKWVGINVDEIPSLWGNADADLWLFAQAIEAKLKERNT